MKHAAVLVVAVLLGVAAAASIPMLNPAEADAATSVKGCTGTTVSMSTAEKRMLDLYNKKRASRGLSRLCVHPALQRAANAHSKDMIENDFFAHETGGRTESSNERMRRYGYRGTYTGENLAWGVGTGGSPGKIMNNWMNSAPHRANILNGRFREVGIGVASGTFRYGGTTYRNTKMWTVDLGSG